MNENAAALEADVVIIVADISDADLTIAAAVIDVACAFKTSIVKEAFSFVVVSFEAATAVEAFSVVAAAVLILAQKRPAKISRAANMVNVVTAAIAPLFTKAPSSGIYADVVNANVIALATFDTVTAV